MKVHRSGYCVWLSDKCFFWVRKLQSFSSPRVLSVPAYARILLKQKQNAFYFLSFPVCRAFLSLFSALYCILHTSSECVSVCLHLIQPRLCRRRHIYKRYFFLLNFHVWVAMSRRGASCRQTTSPPPTTTAWLTIISFIHFTQLHTVQWYSAGWEAFVGVCVDNTLPSTECGTFPMPIIHPADQIIKHVCCGAAAKVMFALCESPFCAHLNIGSCTGNTALCQASPICTYITLISALPWQCVVVFVVAIMKRIIELRLVNENSSTWTERIFFKGRGVTNSAKI